MATDLAFGSVPALYREVYDIVCPNQEQVDHDMFIKLLVKSSLPKTILSQIWDAVDNKQGGLTRTGLYKALALTALAQQGKAISEKLLESYTDSGPVYRTKELFPGSLLEQKKKTLPQELPKPILGDLSDLKALSVRVRRENSPNVLGYTYHELVELDTVKVELVPEKKGLILKHVEYEVTSARYKSTILRRYNDFLALQEMLLLRFPYRMIPRLPPKKMMGVDREFIELRRKSLKRFLNLLGRHPIICDDKILKFFLTFAGPDMQHKIREAFRGVPDEFMTSEVAVKAKELVPMDTQLQFSSSRDHIRALTHSISRIRDVTEKMVLRSTSYASDMLALGKELSALSSDATNVSVWACGTTDTWYQLKKGFKHLSVEYAVLADKSRTQALREEEGIVEELNLYLDLLFAYRDLCERHEKGVLNDHQRALQKMGQYKKKRMSATIQGPSEAGAVEQLEQRILQQESEISNMENRNFFSLHCVQMETQLIHANMEVLYIALQRMVDEESRAHTELGQVWEQIKPIIINILPRDVRNGNGSVGLSLSPRTSPVGSPTSDRPGPGITV